MLKLLALVVVFVGTTSAQTCSGCTDGSVCRTTGEEWMAVIGNFCAYKECTSSGEVSINSYKCYYEPNEECMNVGDSISTGVCTAVECNSVSGTISRDEVINGCESASETCESDGATGFSAVVEGTTYSSCNCTYTTVDDELQYLTSCS